MENVTNEFKLSLDLERLLKEEPITRDIVMTLYKDMIYSLNENPHNIMSTSLYMTLDNANYLI